MAATTRSGINFRQIALIGYVSLCVALVVLTLALSLGEATAPSITATPRATATPNPIVLTRQAGD